MAALLVKHGRPGFYFRVIEEGDVEAGDEIVQVASGPESMSVSEINALLYLPPHPRERLERALQIPALSRGWRRSFAALLEQHSTESAAAGNAGLGPAASPPPAWRGFRPFRVSRKIAETNDVTSLILEPADGHPGAVALPGQFVIVRLGPSATPAMTRSYSLSRAFRCGVLSPQHQTRSPRHRQHLHRRRAPARRPRATRCAPRQLHAAAGHAARCPAERRHRRDAGSRDAPRARCGRIAARCLVAARHPQRPRACLRRRGARTPGQASSPSQPCLLQHARSRRSPRGRFRQHRTSGSAPAPATQCAARRRLLSLRTGHVHERPHDRPPRVGRRTRSHPHRIVRRRGHP